MIAPVVAPECCLSLCDVIGYCRGDWCDALLSQAVIVRRMLTYCRREVRLWDAKELQWFDLCLSPKRRLCCDVINLDSTHCSGHR